ncbi:MAG: hypothetical protein JNG84_00290 [Archangium sp.]|nr:hypothetical protein [Archangium sp.]
MTTPIRRESTQPLPSFDEPEAPPTALSGAISAQRVEKSYAVPHEAVERDERRPLQQRAEERASRIDDAVDTASTEMGRFIVTEKATTKALSALTQLRPDELPTALNRLDADGTLSTLVDSLSPEQLAQFTRQLTRAGVFEWKESTSTLNQPGPAMVQVDPARPDCLRALAHDINLAVAQREPNVRLREPGTDETLHPEDRQRFQWNAGPEGAVQHVADTYASLANVEVAVARLGPGDTYSLKRETTVGVATPGPSGAPEVGVSAAQQSGIEVARKANGYAVTLDAGVLDKASLTLLESKLGLVKVSAGPNASVTTGARVELRFDSAEAAANFASNAAKATTLPTLPGQNLVAAVKAFDAVSLNNLAAVELGHAGAVGFGLKADAAFSSPLAGAALTGAADEAGAAKISARVEFKNGEPVTLVTTAGIRFDEKALAAGGVTTPFDDPKARRMALTTPLKSIGATQRIDIERRVDLTANRDLASIAAAWSQAPGTLTFGRERKEGFGDGSNVKELTAAGSAGFLYDFTAAALRGDAEAVAALAAKGQATLTSKQRTSSTTSLSLGGKLPLEGGTVKVDAGLSSTRTHVSNVRQGAPGEVQRFIHSRL